jgi:HNH endonuclease
MPAHRVPLWTRAGKHINTGNSPGSCWLWTGRVNNGGYPVVFWRGNSRPAHRAFYEDIVGPIPVGLVLDHLCRDPLCVNPLHLEPVTQRENTLRGLSRHNHRHKATVCKHGHEYTAENTVLDARGHKGCRECGRTRSRERYRRKRAAGETAKPTRPIRGRYRNTRR